MHVIGGWGRGEVVWVVHYWRQGIFFSFSAVLFGSRAGTAGYGINANCTEWMDVPLAFGAVAVG